MSKKKTSPQEMVYFQKSCMKSFFLMQRTTPCKDLGSSFPNLEMSFFLTWNFGWNFDEICEKWGDFPIVKILKPFPCIPLTWFMFLIYRRFQKSIFQVYSRPLIFQLFLSWIVTKTLNRVITYPGMQLWHMEKAGKAGNQENL